ncbi:hypothetical protein P152DRAFT_515634 [Eremomyces bilateralis CBS 781.70]|uniref:Uncharacterized protein n=1 Tax=Eremomyces bilateralis CBS 781.70 TaxID=1392243 RepID=A0A6G1FYR5_9PEZI|nr:uncharacterized protein P152DRAFT_515634 [Eremomyces bilateralis CBS 781.70]KAF1810840.1 hypothetical protein P152DRAFT_515634 [Eremomyces bilateralis CBS 781.70]
MTFGRRDRVYNNCQKVWGPGKYNVNCQVPNRGRCCCVVHKDTGNGYGPPLAHTGWCNSEDQAWGQLDQNIRDQIPGGNQSGGYRNNQGGNWGQGGGGGGYGGNQGGNWNQGGWGGGYGGNQGGNWGQGGGGGYGGYQGGNCNQWGGYGNQGGGYNQGVGNRVPGRGPGRGPQCRPRPC